MLDYKKASLSEIGADMNRRFASGEAYSNMVPWDVHRMHEIHRIVLNLAGCTDLLADRPVLDLGCGQGGVIAFWPHKDIVGVEISDVAVAMAQKNYPMAEFYASPVETFLDPKGRTFPVVTAVETIEHWANPRAGLATAKAHMNADSIFVLTTPNYDSLHHRIGRKLGVKVPFCSKDHVHEFGYEELRALLHEAGFEILASKGIGLAPYWALEEEFRERIRSLTDRDPEVVELLGRAGEHIPHIAFIQAHVCGLRR